MGLLARLAAGPARAEPGAPAPRWQDALAQSLLVLLGVALAHYLLYSGTGRWTDNDSPYHQLVIAEIWKHGFWRDITWLPYTILRDAGPDQHWLWHLLLAPFAAIDDLGTRIDVMNAFSFALIPASTNFALRMLGVRTAPFWVLLMMAVTIGIANRWSQIRAQNIAYLYLALFLVALERRNHLALGVIAFLFMDSYHGAAMLAAPGLLMFGLRWWRHGERDWLVLVAPAGGAMLALITNPWYPHDIEYFLFHTLDKVGNRLALDVGNEWYPVPPAIAAQVLLPQLAVLGIVLWAARTALADRLSDITIVALGAALFFFVLTLQHMRFMEYCPQTLVLSAALVARDCREQFGPSAVRRSVLWLAGVAAIVLFVISMTDRRAKLVQATQQALDRDVEVGQFLTAHSQPGELVCNTQWDDFPFLVANAPGLRFLTGLDPYYLAYGDEKKFIAIAQLNEFARMPPGTLIPMREMFGCNWVITSRRFIVGYLIKTHQVHALLASGSHFLVYVGNDPAMLARLRGDATGNVHWIRIRN